jgi:hypothetical protein
MRRLSAGMPLLLTILFGTSGCAGPDITLRPPKHPEDIVVPPLADAKFSNPPKYPEGTLNQNDPSRSPNGGAGGPPNMSAMNGGGMGAMNGRGGMGGMGGGMGGMGGGMGGMGR